MEKTKVLLVYSKHSPFPHTKGVPLTIFAIGTYLEKHGYEVLYFDQRVEKMKKLKELLKQKPLLAGLSTMTSYQITTTLEIAKLIRETDPSIKLAWGGVHPSMLPVQTAESEYVDFVIKSEGEKTIVELLEKLKKNETNFEEVDGLVWKKDGKIMVNKDREFSDFSDFPSGWNETAKKMLVEYLKKDTNSTARQPVFYITARGCSFKCTFCYITDFSKNTWRPRNTELVRKELTELKELGVDKVFFGDDNFGNNIEHLTEICKITKDLGLKWGATMRIGVMIEPTVKMMEESGCEYVLYGIESGSQAMLDKMIKQQTLEQIKRGIQNIAKTKIVPMYSIIFGFPEEEPDHMEKTFELVDYMKKTDPKATVFFQIYTPFPGSSMYHTAIKNGFKPPQKLEEWADYVMDEVKTPWVKDKTLLRNLYVISLLAFRNKQFFSNLIFYPFHYVAKLRWKHRYFKLCYERVIYDVIKKVPWLN